MTNLTKKAIKECFVALLEKKPYNQITVKDIVEECGINRNSFYYHYADLAAVAEEVVMENADKIIAEHPSICSLEEFLDTVINFVLDNKKTVLHLYNSVRRDMFELYLWKVCEHCSEAYIGSLISAHNIGDAERKLIINHFKCAGFGEVLGWLNDGMKNDIKQQNALICELKRGMTEEMVERCERIKK
ncbi:MAG: TetR/AcrR family transcriptional regulator [Ruminiclostridium sp.]|uniref:TetR/AcrR family transcriptional regulator n=1 Tax=Ruminococcus sp. TaxID=41978 RepID=UPI0025E17B09|nr:TetR/AcrR family transcriptional regulator [Ruminococcus sp.]MBR1433320.1 TetR/AcrR family transcriptional regulator [Ruminococcus sp.]MBR1831444.1 TetR/AcrR family transcriptional regulator [Ruminiclostridium sp.]